MAFVRAGKVLSDETAERLVSFKNDLTAMTPDEVYDKHILGREPCVLTPEGQKAIFSEFNGQWGLVPQSLRLVGSAVTGFSIKRNRRYEMFDFNTSDIDIAIIDADFFAEIWEEVRRFIDENIDWSDQLEFEEYLVKGWLRPDKFPKEMFNEWFDFFKSVQNTGKSGGIKVRAAIYPSEYFLRDYQTRGIADCIQERLP